MNALPVLAALAVFVAFCCREYFTARSQKKRRLELSEFAETKGWQFSLKDPGDVAKTFKSLDQLGFVKDWRVRDVVAGVWESSRFCAFNYLEGVGRTESWRSVVSVHHGVDHVVLPELKIGKENALKRLGYMVAGNDIDFDSDEFSRRFAVRSADKKFAYDFCNGSMMDYLLAESQLIIGIERGLEIEGEWISIVKLGKLKVEDIEPLLALLSGIRQRIPEHVFQSRT